MSNSFVMRGLQCFFDVLSTITTFRSHNTRPKTTLKKGRSCLVTFIPYLFMSIYSNTHKHISYYTCVYTQKRWCAETNGKVVKRKRVNQESSHHDEREIFHSHMKGQSHDTSHDVWTVWRYWSVAHRQSKESPQFRQSFFDCQRFFILFHFVKSEK